MAGDAPGIGVGTGVAWGPEGAEGGVEVAVGETGAEPPGG
jgi:hypothetical protein